MKKVRIEVCKKGERHGEPGDAIEVIERAVWFEAIGNFNPMFCKYKNKRTLVQSYDGDLSDPFRRDESYLETLYIEIDTPASNAASVMGRKGGLSRSPAKCAANRVNGAKGGRPRKTQQIEGGVI